MPGKRASLEIRFFEKINKTETCWIWIGCKDPKGYGRIGTGGRAGKDVFAHRLSYVFHKGEIPQGMLVCHKCDNPACVNPDHLFIGTQFDNMRDCVRKGRLKPFRPIGELAHNTKLSWKDVKEIRASPQRGWGYRIPLAKKYGVSTQIISRIIKNETWIES